MRLLLTLHDAGGTVPPMVALTEAAVARGHDVTVLSQPSVQRRAETVGARFAAFSSLPDYDHRRSFDDQLALIGAAIVGREVGDDLLALAGEADVVVVDANLAGALAAVETIALPSAVLLHSVYATYTDVWFADLWPLLAGGINATRAAFGLQPADGWPAVFTAHDRLLSVVPSVFEPPVAIVPNSMRHFGFLVPSVAPTDVDFPPGDGPTVLVGLGTTSQDQQPVFEAVVDALARVPVRALVTTAGQAAIAGRPNVRIVDHAPHGALLPHTDLFLNHGGLGSIAAGLDAGVPLICIPFDRDQPLNAARVADLGLGLVTTAADVGVAIERVVGDPSFRAAARDLSLRSRAEGGADAAVRELEAL